MDEEESNTDTVQLIMGAMVAHPGPMTEPRPPHETDEDLVRATTWRAMTALGLLASFAVGSLLLFWLQTRTMDSGARVLNMAGRQRMLSQRAALITVELAVASDDESRRLRRELERVSRRLADAHRALRDGDPELGLPAPPPQVTRLYLEPPALDERIGIYVEALGELAAAADPAAEPALRRHIVDTALRGRLLNELDAVVSAFQAHEEAKVARLEKAQWVVFGLTLLVIVATRRTVIGPMVVRLRRYLRDLHQHHERLARVNRLATMGEMAAGIAHEINQPLAAINTYAFVARRQLPTKLAAGEIGATLAKISTQAERAGQVIRRVRALSENRQSERVLVELEPVIADAVELANADARHRSYRLELELGGISAVVLIDEIQIQQVILNLIRNAAEAFPPGHEIEPIVVRTASGARWVSAEVADRGVGLPEEQVDLLFQPFYTTKEAGSGLGLAMARSIIEAHGGRLELKANPAGGTVATVILPTAEAMSGMESRADA